MGEKSYSVTFIFSENHSLQKSVLILDEKSDYDSVLQTANQKLRKKIRTVYTEDHYRYQPLFLKNQLKLLCSPKENPVTDLRDAPLELAEAEKSAGMSPFEQDTLKQIFFINSYIPDGAISQLYNLPNHYGGISHLFGMPDLHQGKRCPIGAVVVTRGSDQIHPDLVGEDIGCGMAFYKTNKMTTKTSERQLENFAKKLYLEGPVTVDFSTLSECNYPGFSLDESILSAEITWGAVTVPTAAPPLASSFSLAEEKKEQLLDYFQNSLEFLGTIGAGNHFAELQEIDELFVDRDIAHSQYNLDDRYYYLTVHSGSRGLGEQVLHNYQDGDILLEEYKQLHDYCLDWAKKNRYAIAARFLSQLDCRFEDCSCLLDLSHNFCEVCCSPGRDKSPFVVHRKGAAPAYPDQENLIIIPGSRGTHTYLVQATRNNSLQKNGLSVSHGAGRKVTRTAAQEIMKDCSAQEREKKLHTDERINNNLIICEKKELFYEEAPFAYKDIEVVIDDLVELGLVRKIASLKPVITYKQRE